MGSLPCGDWEGTGKEKNQLSPTMEEHKAETEKRKLRSQALEKTARSKKKTEIREKKEQKAEVKRKIEDSLPTLPDNMFRCSACTLPVNYWVQGWVCQDEKKHQREWMVKSRRVMLKDAFQEQAQLATGFSKLRKLGAAKKFALSSDDLDDDCFSDEEEEYADAEETTWQKPTEILEDLSAFLVKKCAGKNQRPRKQTIRISPEEQFHKPRPTVVGSEERIEKREHDILSSEHFNLLEKLDEIKEEDEEYVGPEGYRPYCGFSSSPSSPSSPSPSSPSPSSPSSPVVKPVISIYQ